MDTISAVIPVRNVAPIMRRCLDALVWADEVIVVDMYSTDETEQICRSYPNVRFYQNQDYIFANFNYGLDRARGDWILQIDSDEVVTPGLAAEIREKVLARSSEAAADGYWIPSRVYFFGRLLRYGPAFYSEAHRTPSPPPQPKLFRRGTARHECRSEHESLGFRGTVGRLEQPFEHYSHPTVASWIAKMNYYTDRDVERMDVLAPGFRLPRPRRTLVALVAVFYDLYVRRKGYRDGIHGFMACALNTGYLLVLRCKIWEKHWRLTHADEVVPY